MYFLKIVPLLAAAALVLLGVRVGAYSAAPPLQSDPATSLHPLLTFPAPPSNLQSSITPHRAPLDRLPRHVIPTHYKLHFQPILNPALPNFGTAEGRVEIAVEATESGTNSITLHLTNTLVVIDEPSLKLTSVSDGQDLGPLTTEYFPDQDFVTITIATEGVTFTSGEEYLLHIEFVTNSQETVPFGYWVAPATDPATGEAPFMSTTILEPNFARGVLPCFDEPDLKAIFEISLGHDAEHFSLAHTPKLREEIIGGVIWDHYRPTPIMSVYQLCLVIVPNHYEVAIDNENFPDAVVMSWGPGAHISNGAGDLSVGTISRSLTYFQETYGIPYGLPKFDSVVIPGFPAGALENWGVNMYREGALLHFGLETREVERGSAAGTQNHEVSHQWFGNLVTCKWWDDIWLNEGFANYLSFKGVARTTPELQPGVQFVSDSVQVAMKADQNANTHPLHFKVLPANWMGIFDSISYAKGGSLLRMLEGILGEELLIEGFKEYLNTYAFGAADQDDLFASIQRAVNSSERPLPEGMSIKSLMDNWTLQAGFPLVRVSRGSATRVFVSQERYGSGVGMGADPAFWDIPIAIVKAGGSNNRNGEPEFWLRSTTALTSYAEGIDTTKWLMLNPDAFGYYRVHYDAHLFQLILNQLDSNHNAISPGSKSQLIDDYFNFAALGYVDIVTALHLTKYLAVERELVVWAPVLEHLYEYYAKLSGTDGFLAFERYMGKRVGDALNEIGWTQDPMDPATEKGNIVVMRANLFDWACGLGLEECGREAERLFPLYRAEPRRIFEIIAVDLQAPILCSAVASPTIGAQAHAFLLEQYKLATTSPALKARQLNGLACTMDTGLFQGTLELALDPAEIVNANDRIVLLQRLAMNSYTCPSGSADCSARALTWEHVKENVLNRRLTVKEFSTVVGTLSGYWYLEEDAVALETFVADNEELLDSELVSLNGSVARVRANSVWMNSKGKVVVEWMLGENVKENKIL